MRDTIYRDEAIDAVINNACAAVFYNSDNTGVLDILNALPSAEAVQGWIPVWIPVSERLPSEDGRYLVCMKWEYDNMEVLKWADGWNCFRYPNGKVSRESEIDGADIIAWMPLPKPYKGGDSK